MATYLYCVRSDAATVPSRLRGIDDAEVRSLAVDDLIAWVSDVQESPPATIERLKAHDAVCAAALAIGDDTPLPVRFGQIFADDSAAIASLEDRLVPLRKRLVRVAGCAEMRVVVRRGREIPESTEVEDFDDEPVAAGTATESDSGIDGPGTAFLKRLARAGRDDLSREVGCEEARHAVKTAARDLIVELDRCEAARGLAFFPVLVRRGNADSFRALVNTLQVAQKIDVTVFGPFAPYSFAGDA